MRHAAFLGKSSSILVASSPFNLSPDCLFSTLIWSIAYFPCLIELFYHLANRFKQHLYQSERQFFSKEQLCDELQLCAANISSDEIENLTKSMDRRLLAVVEARRGYINY